MGDAIYTLKAGKRRFQLRANTEDTVERILSVAQGHFKVCMDDVIDEIRPSRLVMSDDMDEDNYREVATTEFLGPDERAVEIPTEIPLDTPTPEKIEKLRVEVEKTHDKLVAEVWEVKVQESKVVVDTFE
jgi:hypothetical protein